MNIVNILAQTGILLGCSIIQVIGVVVEGLGKLFTTTAEYLNMLHDKLRDLLNKPKKTTEEIEPL